MDGTNILGIGLSLCFGFIPMFIFAAIVYWSDRYEKEPKKLLVAVFLWGALAASGSAFLINSLLGMGVYIFTRSEVATELTTGSLIAPFVEELMKGIAVLAVFLMFRDEFDSLFDGMVYAAICALGFAATENSYYIYTYGFAENGIAGAFILAFIRVILVGWQHPFYTAFTGIGLAIARLNRNLAVKIIAPVTGLSLAMLTHSAHNTLSRLIPGLTGLASTTILDWSGWLVMILFGLWTLYREQRWIVQYLREEVSLGIITADQYRVACSAWAQSLARLSSLFRGRYGATNRFYQATAELAFKKQKLAIMGESDRNILSIEHLRTELAQLSPLAGG